MQVPSPAIRRPQARWLLPAAAALVLGCGDGGVEPRFDALEVTTAALPDATQGELYTFSLSAAGGDGSYRWAITGAMSLGTPPSGVWLDTDGTLSGTPAFVESKGFTVEVRSGDGQTATRALMLTVNAP